MLNKAPVVFPFGRGSQLSLRCTVYSVNACPPGGTGVDDYARDELMTYCSDVLHLCYFRPGEAQKGYCFETNNFLFGEGPESSDSKLRNV